MKQIQLFQEQENKQEQILNDFFDKNTSSIRRGFAGEQLCRMFLKKHGKTFHQVDYLFENNGRICSVEVKASEMYNNPNAHGLSVVQYEKKVSLYRKHNIVPYLFVHCQTTNKIYWNNFIDLKNGNEFLSKTGRMILFPIESFNTYETSNYIR